MRRPLSPRVLHLRHFHGSITEGCNARKVSTIEPDAAIEAAGRIARHRWVFSRACPIACDRYARRRQSFDTSMPTVIFSLATVLV